MRKILIMLSVFALASCANAAVTEIGALTVPNVWIDFDNVAGPGPTTMAAIIGAATPSPAVTITDLRVPVKAAAAGVYNTNPGLGRAWARIGGGLGTVDPPAGSFEASTFEIDFNMMVTEIGFSVGDWNGEAVLQLFSGGGLVDTYTSTPYSATAQTKFYQSTIPFDSIAIDVSTAAGNFVIPDLYVQIPEPATLCLLVLGGLALRRR